MTTIHTDAERRERLIVFTKGAPDVLLARCSHELVGAEARPLGGARRAEILKVNEALGSRSGIHEVPEAGVSVLRILKR